MAKDSWYEDKQKLDYKDSWLQNTVELAALGAIVAGAGNLAIRGDFKGLAKPGKKVMDVMTKGYENYLKRNGSHGVQFGYNVGRKVFGNLKKYPRQTGDENRKLLRDLVEKSIDQTDQKKLRQDIANKLRDDGRLSPFTKEKGLNTWADVVDDVLDNKGKIQDNRLKNDIKTMYQLGQGKEVDKGINFRQPPAPTKQKAKWFGNNDSDNTPLFDKKELSRNMISSGLSAVAFGAGLTGVHALDRVISNKDNQDKLEEAFNLSGSFIPKKEDDKSMKKQAGAIETKNFLKMLGKKTPESVASGIGFTGVSLGTAKLINDKKEKNEEGESKGTRVIIELGDPQLDNDKHNLANASSGGLSLLPKHSSEEISGLAKLAFKNSFLKDLAGHKDEIKRLESVNFEDAAASQLKNADVPGLLKQQYGNLYTDKTEAQLTKDLINSRSKQIKENADEQIYNLQNRAAKAQLIAGAGALGVGGGLAGLAYQNRGEENV